MKWVFILLHFFLFFTTYLFSQSVGIGTDRPDSLAQLDVNSSSKGMLIPRLTNIARNKIVHPPAGLMIYNTTTNNYNLYDGTSWKAMQKELPAGVQLLADTGQSVLSELGFYPMGDMYLSYRLPSQLLTIPDSTWHSINQNDPDSLNNPVLNTFGMFYWIGSEGLYLKSDSNYRYNPVTDGWTSFPNNINAVLGSGIWTGTELIIWDGNNPSHVNKIYRFTPQTNLWTIHDATFPYPTRYGYSIVWVNNKLIVWGGVSASVTQNNGAIYNPGNNSWLPIAMPIALQSSVPARYRHTALAVGIEMIVWGGIINLGCIGTRTGFRLQTQTLSFSALPLLNAPAFRLLHTAVWTGSEMIIFGGTGGPECNDALYTGGKFNLASNTWEPISNADFGLSNHQAFWSGNRMIIIGGTPFITDNSINRDCLSYNPVDNSWSREFGIIPSEPQPGSAVWTGNKIIVLARLLGNNVFVKGYTFSTEPALIMQAPPRRETKFSVWRKN